MVVNTSTVFPALVANVTYTIKGNAPAQTAQGVDVPVIAWVFGVAVVAIGAVYIISLMGKWWP